MANDIFTILSAVGGVLMVVGILYLVVAVVVAVQIYSFAVTRLVKLPKLTLAPKQHRLFKSADDWAEKNGFHYVGIHRFQILLLAIWENPKESSFLCQYLNFNAPYYELTTCFDKHIILETSNLRDEILVPAFPGFYQQVFLKKSLEELWQCHLDTQQYLENFGNVELTPYKPEFPWGNVPSNDPFAEPQPLAFEVALNSSSRTLAKYVRSLWFWFLRWPHWYFYRRFFWVHKTIQEQVEMGRLVLPQDLPFDYEDRFVHWQPKKSSDGFEPMERSKLFSPEHGEENDLEPLYSREYAVEPKTVGRLGKTIQWAVLLLVFLGCGILPLSFGLYNYFGEKAYKKVQQLLAEEKFDEALERAIKISNKRQRERSISFVAQEQASAERYDDALQTAKLLNGEDRSSLASKDWLYHHIVLAKAADEQFEGLDDLVHQIRDRDHQDSTYIDIAVAQAKAGLMGDAEKTLDQLDEKAKARARFIIARAVFEAGRTDEAIAIVQAMQAPESNDTKITILVEFARKFAKENNIETARNFLFECLEIVDKAEKRPNSAYLLRSILSVFREAGKPEEGLRFVQEIAPRYPDKKAEDAEISVAELMPYYVVLVETAMLNAEFGHYAEAWKLAESLPMQLNEYTVKSQIFMDILRIAQKNNVNMKAEMKRIEKQIEPFIADADTSEEQIKLLRKLLDYQIAVRCFQDATVTAERRAEIKLKNQFGLDDTNLFWADIVKGQAEAGQIDDALKTVKKTKMRPYVWNYIAFAEAKADRFDEALKHARNEDWILSDIVRIQIDKGKLAEAEKMSDSIKSPEFKVVAALDLAEAYFDANQKDAADRLVVQLVPMMNRCLEASWSGLKPKQFSRIAVLEAKLGRFSEALKTAQRISILSVDKRAETLSAIAAAQTAAGKPDDAKQTREKIRWKFWGRNTNSTNEHECFW